MDLNFVLDIPLWITVLLLATAASYLYLTWNFGFLEKQGVKVKRPWPLIGSLGNILNQVAMNFDLHLYQKYGRVCGFYEGRNPVLLVGEPELIKQVTVKDFGAFPFSRDLKLGEKEVIAKKFLTLLKGEEWKQMRNLMTPSFTTGKLKQMTHLIEDCCKTLNDHLTKYAESGEPVEAKKFMSSFTLDVIALCAFGTKIDCMGNPDSAFVRHASNIFNIKISPLAFISFLVPPLSKVLPAFQLFPPESAEYLKTVVEQVIEMRKTGKHPRDFLALLLEAKIDEDEQCDATTETQKLEATKKGVSIELLLAQSVLFLAAGYETTATLLSLTLYELAMNPSVQEKLADEVNRLISKNDGKIDYQIMTEMSYVDMVISETLRMYPPATRTERTCVEEGYDLGGVILKKGMLIGIPVYSIHHDPEFYPDPEKFDPERFTPENKANRNPFTYLPFGAGPRNCIASRFALMEAKMTLAFMIKEFIIKKCPQTEEKIEYSIGTSLLQPKSVTVAIEKRPKK